MKALNATLGLKVIPARFVSAFVATEEEFGRALTDARKLMSQSPKAWEIVEVPSGGAVQPQDVPFKSVPVELSDEQRKLGREQIKEAYSRIDAALKAMDDRIRQIERSGLRKLLLLVGLGLVLIAVTIIVIGIFTKSEIKLVGKDGAASLLLATGIGLLVSSYKTDRQMRTLTSRVRARLAVCLGYPNYEDVLHCFSTGIDELLMAFGNIQRHVKSKGRAATDVSF